MTRIIYNGRGDIIYIVLNGVWYQPARLLDLINKTKAWKQAIDELNGIDDAEKELIKAIERLKEEIL